MVEPSLAFPPCEIIVYFKPSSTWKERTQQVEGWKGRSFSLLSHQESSPPAEWGWISWSCFWCQLGVLLVVVANLHLKPNPLLAVALHLKPNPLLYVAWVGSSPPAFLASSAVGNSPKMLWSSSHNGLGIILSLLGWDVV